VANSLHAPENRYKDDNRLLLGLTRAFLSYLGVR
jgi:hypothetical protein